MFRFVLNVISEGVSSRDDNVSFFFQKREKGDITIRGNDLPGCSIFLLILQRKKNGNSLYVYYILMDYNEKESN